MFQITPQTVIVDDAKLASVRTEFAERHCVLMQRALSPAVLTRLLPLVGDAPIRETLPGKAVGKIIARELCVEPGSLVAQAFTLLFNNSILFRLVETLTGCPAIGNFQGRIYMMRPEAGHYDTWHSDNDGNRLIGLSCNLSMDIYSGGTFQIRERQSERLVGEISNIVCGDTHIFRIGPELQHRVTPVTGTVTKAAYAGWFRAQPASRDMFGVTTTSPS
jgi:2OG-Fe(II) oxygenase superfamily